MESTMENANKEKKRILLLQICCRLSSACDSPLYNAYLESQETYRRFNQIPSLSSDTNFLTE